MTLTFFIPLLLAIIVEVILALIFIKGDRRRVVRVFVAANLLTNPLANSLNYLYINHTVLSDEPLVLHYVLVLFLIEMGVVIAETILFKKYLGFNTKKALKISLLFNLASLILGVVLYRVVITMFVFGLALFH